MPILIDCYNLLRQPMPPGLAGLDEMGLCRALQRSGLARSWVTIVCDGAPKPHFPARVPLPGVKIRVIYAGKGAAADPLLMDEIAAASAPRRLFVVSNDREIQRAAKRRQAVAMSCEQFIHQLLGALAQGDATQAPPIPTARPRLQEDSDEIKRWAKEFGVDPNAKLE